MVKNISIWARFGIKLPFVCSAIKCVTAWSSRRELNVPKITPGMLMWTGPEEDESFSNQLCSILTCLPGLELELECVYQLESSVKFVNELVNAQIVLVSI